MVDAWWFWFAGFHFSKTGDFAAPVVLDWAIDAAGSSCLLRHRKQSVCLDSSNGSGYTWSPATTPSAAKVLALS
jgi:hypothetical protein